MRIFSAVLIVSLGLLTLTSCVEMQALDVRPKSRALLIDSTDVLYVKDSLTQTAKDYDLEPQELVSSDMIASYQGGKKGTFSNWYRIHPTVAASKPESFGDRYQWAYASRRDDTQ